MTRQNRPTTGQKRPRSFYNSALVLIAVRFITLCQYRLTFTVQAWTWSPLMAKHSRPLIVHFSQADEAEDDEDDEDDYYDGYEQDTKTFSTPPSFLSSSSHIPSFGLLRGRSAPAHRKAMSKSSSAKARIYSCGNCGAEFVNWVGKCHTCQRYNSVQEVWVTRDRDTSTSLTNLNSWPKPAPTSSTKDATSTSSIHSASFTTSFSSPPTTLIPLDQVMSQTNDPLSFRWNIPQDSELNAVLGGGLVPGSLILLGGDPGIGKSTLLLQTAFRMASSSQTIWYISGEETALQIASRAQRLGFIHSKDRMQMYKNDSSKNSVSVSNLYIFTETNMDRIVETLEQSLSSNPPSLILVDSIQTMICPSVSSSFTGSIAQVRECVSMFLQVAKSTNIPIFLIGHVTKQGDVAGPKTVEHLVDAVLYLEQSDPVLILRAVKNRFGSIQQVGMYQRSLDEDCPGLLEPVSDPSQLFLQDMNRRKDIQGCAVSLVMEGPRAFAMEIQALVSSPGSSWTRTTCIVQGITQARVYLIIALLSKLYHIQLGRYDVYVNIVGGFDRSRGGGKGSNALDLAVAVALLSSLYQIPVRADTAFVGEVGLLGELRPVMDMEKRFAEAVRMGFSRIITPKIHRPRQNRGKRNVDEVKVAPIGLEHIQLEHVMDAVQAGLVQPIRKLDRNGKTMIPSVGRIWKRGLKRSFKREGNRDDETDGEEIYLK